MTITCGTGGCALLKRFDANNDGIINQDEMRAAEELMMHGDITEGEFSFVRDAYIAGSIDALCPGCYTPAPAKGNVYNLDYPANAKNGETITIKASVVNKGGTSGDFSLRVIAAPQIPLVTRRVGIVSAYKFTAPVNLQVTMPSSGTVANLGVQCISMDGVIDDTKKFTIALTPPPVTCTGGSPHYGTGCALLKHYDTDNDGIVTARDARMARESGESIAEVQFILDASAAGSINAKCPGCYTPHDPCAGVTCANGCWGTSLYSKKCVDGHCVKDTLIKSNAPECGYVAPTPVTCTGGSPHYGTGCALLKHYDTDNDGIVTARDARMARESGESIAEVQFILDASAAGSINAKCPGCYTPHDPCAGVTCANGCWGTSLYSKKCVDGHCVKDTLIKSNAPECGYVAPTPVTCTGGSPHYGTGCALLKHYDTDNDGIVTARDARMARESGESIAEVQFILDASAAGSINAKCPGCYTPHDPCAGVTCANGCWGTSLYSKKCVDGHCVKDTLIKSNAPECGYVAPTPVTCTGGSPHYGTGCALLKHYDTDNDGIVTARDARMARESGESIAEVQFILDASAAGSINAKCPGCYTPHDPCAGVTCANGCWGTSLYSKKCVDGHCVKDTLIKSNAPECGYVAPTPVTCTGGSPHYGTGCALLKHYDTDNDGIVTARDARMARESGESIAEVQFILDASAAGSINAKCPGCYTPPPPAKGNVHNLDYPANAKNGETITIKASVVNKGGTSGDFSLRVIAAPQIPLVTRRVGIVSAYKFTAPVNLQVTMPSSGTVANLGVQCIRHT